MARRNNNHHRAGRQRLAVAQAAARILLESGNRDYAAAKRKAAERLGVRDRHGLPANHEIEAALAELQRIFHADSQPQTLARLRRQAVAAMELLAPFRPRLVGAVLRGTADAHSPIHLHVFADSPEAVTLFLMEREIPFEHGQRRVRLDEQRRAELPVCRFIAGGDRVELTVFPPEGERQPPLSPVDGRPMARADLKAVQRLLGDEGLVAE